MSKAFFYRERKGLFVVTSLAIWLVGLGLFGRYLPANAQVKSRQMVVNYHGNELLGKWVRRNGRWTFGKVSRIMKVHRSKMSESETMPVEGRSPVHLSGSVLSRRVTSGVMGAMASVAVKGAVNSYSPATTAALPAHRSTKQVKRAMRARLAKEIGRWARIGDRWEWRSREDQPPRKEVRQIEERRKMWVRRNGIWVFAVPEAADLMINI